jgi:predicted nucleic acid-binding protein
VVLVDTSVWIEYFKQRDEVIEAELDDLLRSGRVAVCGLILAELRRGCRTPADVAMLLAALTPLEYFEADRRTWLRAGEIVSDCARRGFALGVGDCLLAALALREDCLLFTLDRDFERIPGLKLHRPRVT